MLQFSNYWVSKFASMKSLLITIWAVLIANFTNAQLKIVFQLTSNDSLVHKAVIRQFKNILKEDPTVKLAVVCHGPGIEMLMKEKTVVYPSIQELSKKGVEFVACENTMVEKKMEKIQLVDGLKYVKAGIIEVAKRQQEGWSYIKAGF